MYCSVCGKQLPTGGVVCPNCGASVSSLPSAAPGLSTASPNDPTFVASSNPYLTLSSPSTGSSSNPYETVLPPPPSGFKSGRRRGILIGAIIGLVVLVVLAGLLVTLRFYTQASGTTQAQPTPGPTQIAATATAIASRNPYPPYTGTLVLNDPLRDNSAGYQWSVGQQAGFATCGFSGGQYHTSLAKRGYDYCGPQANGLVFSNLAYEANITMLQGDYAGIWFRFDKIQKTRYLFFITANGFVALSTDNNDSVNILWHGHPEALRPGHQTNLLAVVAIGNMMSMYINNQMVGSIQDSTYQQGQIGVFAQGVKSGFDVIVSDVRVWTL